MRTLLLLQAICPVGQTFELFAIVVHGDERRAQHTVLVGHRIDKAGLADIRHDRLVDGFDVEMVVEVGDKVIVGKYAGTEVKVGDDKCIIVRQSDILARVEE